MSECELVIHFTVMICRTFIPGWISQNVQQKYQVYEYKYNTKSIKNIKPETANHWKVIDN